MVRFSTFSSTSRAIFAALALTAICLGAARAQTRLPTAGFADIAERVTPAVVNISTRHPAPGADTLPRFPPGSPLERLNPDPEAGVAEAVSLGSGFLISPDGLVVTNDHVVAPAGAIEVLMQDGQRFDATLIGRDPATDLALLRIETDAPLPFAVLGDSGAARVGDIVLAIGNPFGLGGSVSLGIVSARNRNIEAGRYDDFIQTDAAINRGNSGGPLFNTRGEVIGVNTAIVSPSGESVGVGFATPSAIVRRIVGQLRDFGEVRRGWLGVRLVDAEGGEDGARVTRVTPRSPAAEAGIRVDDVILSFDGKELRDARMLTRLVADTDIDTQAPLVLMRNGERLEVIAQIAQLAEPEPFARAEAPAAHGGRIGALSLTEVDAGLRSQLQLEPGMRGLAVISVEDTANARTGFLAGDVIVECGGAPVSSFEMLAARAETARRGDEALVVKIERGGASTYRVLRP